MFKVFQMLLSEAFGSKSDHVIYIRKHVGEYLKGHFLSKMKC